MTTTRWENKISLGHVISLLGLLALGVGAWNEVRGSQRAQETLAAQLGVSLSAEVARSQAEDKELDDRMRAVEVAASARAADLAAIRAGVAEIKAQLDRLLREGHER